MFVVRSPVGAPNEPGQIFHIGVADDPFSERSYDPPFRGSHGAGEGKTGIVRIPVPLPFVEENETLDRALEGLSLEVYRLRDSGQFFEGGDAFLTPETFQRHENAFEPRAVRDESDLRKLLDQTTHEQKEPQAMLHSSSMTQLHYSGPRSKKFNFVVIGDGFANTTADQNAFNNYVDDVVMDDLLAEDIHPEMTRVLRRWMAAETLFPGSLVIPR